MSFENSVPLPLTTEQIWILEASGRTLEVLEGCVQALPYIDDGLDLLRKNPDGTIRIASGFLSLEIHDKLLDIYVQSQTGQPTDWVKVRDYPSLNGDEEKFLPVEFQELSVSFRGLVKTNYHDDPKHLKSYRLYKVKELPLPSVGAAIITQQELEYCESFIEIAPSSKLSIEGAMARHGLSNNLSSRRRPLFENIGGYEVMNYEGYRPVEGQTLLDCDGARQLASLILEAQLHGQIHD